MKLGVLILASPTTPQAAARPRCGRPAPCEVKPGTAKKRGSESVRVAFQESEDGKAWTDRALSRQARHPADVAKGGEVINEYGC